MRKVLIAGCGFLGETAAFLFQHAGSAVTGLCASAESARSLSGRLNARVCDLRHSAELQSLEKTCGAFDVVVHCASSGRGDEAAYRAVYLEGMQNLVSVFPCAKHLFAGSTSVYAQTDGGIVDEHGEAHPSRATGRILLEAEKVCLEAGGIVLRLAGLYGPGRWVLATKFLSGEARIDRGRERWINQIHRDDAARAIVHLAGSDHASEIYNACDDTPATQRHIYEFLAEYFSRPLPPEGEPDLQRKRGWSSKRVSNAKLRATGWRPEFPSYREAARKMFPSPGDGISGKEGAEMSSKPGR